MNPILLIASICAELFLILFFAFGPVVIYVWLGLGLLCTFGLWLVGAALDTHLNR